MKDGFVRAGLKRAALAHFVVNLWLHRRLKRLAAPPAYELGGACRLCAKCCEAPAIRANALVWRLRGVRRAFLWWQERVNGFELASVERRSRSFVFRCTHFDPSTRRCDSYATRPGVCRDYPRALLDQPGPELLQGCGYRVLARERRRWLQALEARGLSPEQMEKLKKGLHLDE